MISTAKAVSKRSIQLTTSQRVKDLKQIKLKRNTDKKRNWGVAAYNRWRQARLEAYNYDVGIYFADINNLQGLEKDNFIHSMTYFLPEVNKQDGDLFPGKTLYQLVRAIQKHLNVNKIPWRLIDDPEFLDICTVLDNLMKERKQMGIGVEEKVADIITFDMEKSLWDRGFMGEETPLKLQRAVYFGLGMQCYLRSKQDHYSLRRWTPSRNSQITFENNNDGVRCLVYREDHVTKTHDGGINDMKHKRKEVVIFPNLSNPSRDIVYLVDKYLGLCPPMYSKSNFYLKPLQKPTPAQWYGYQVLGEKSIAKILPEMMEEAGYKGYYTGHSLRRSGGSRLFQAGVQRKLVKECTGHASDAVDSYQITSYQQKKIVSEIVQGQLDIKPKPSTSTTPVVGDAADTSINSTNCDTKPKVENPATHVIRGKCYAKKC